MWRTRFGQQPWDDARDRALTLARVPSLDGAVAEPVEVDCEAVFYEALKAELRRLMQEGGA